MSVSLPTTPASPPRRLALRAVTALFASVALLLSGALTLAPAANAASDASISGVLRDHEGDPLVDWEIQLYRGTDASDIDSTDVAKVRADEDGAFSFTNLPAGRYAYFVDGGGDYRDQYSGAASAFAYATKFDLAEGEAKTGADMTMSLGWTISGKITASGAPARGTNVELVRWSPGEEYGYGEGSRSTTNSGNYEFDEILRGEYSVIAYGNDGHVTQWFGGTTNSSQTPPKRIVVSGADRTGVNIALVMGGSVSGAITGADGTPVTNGSAVLYRIEKDAWGFEYYYDVNGSDTWSNGLYSIDRVEPGTYTLAFDDYKQKHERQYLGGAKDIGGAARFTVKQGEAKNLNVKLRTKAFVSPSVTKITLTKSSRAHGVTSTATVSVTGKAAAAGTVKLIDGSKTIGTKAVVGGKATFTLPAKLAVGKHSLRAVFTSSGTTQSSTSAAAVLTVTKAASAVSAKANKKGSKLAVTVSAKGVTPGGKYVVKAGKTTVAKGKLKKGKASVKLGNLAAGKHKLTVTYRGSSTVKGSATKVTVKVKS